MKIDFVIQDINSSSLSKMAFSASENDAKKLLDYPSINGDLFVEFKNGMQYIYKDVPFELVIHVGTALSMGAEFHANIVQGGFDFEKI